MGGKEVGGLNSFGKGFTVLLCLKFILINKKHFIYAVTFQSGKEPLQHVEDSDTVIDKYRYIKYWNKLN